MVKKIFALFIMILMVASVVLGQGMQKKGLDIAIDNANGEAKQKLVQVQERLQEQSRERVNQLEQIRLRETQECNDQGCTNLTYIDGQKRVKFLGFINVDREYSYRVTEEGNIAYRTRFTDFMFREA